MLLIMMTLKTRYSEQYNEDMVDFKNEQYVQWKSDLNIDIT